MPPGNVPIVQQKIEVSETAGVSEPVPDICIEDSHNVGKDYVRRTKLWNFQTDCLLMCPYFLPLSGFSILTLGAVEKSRI